MCKQNYRSVIMILTVVLATLATVIIVPIFNETDPIHKKYLTHIVSVLSTVEQKKFLLRHKAACFKLINARAEEYRNKTLLPEFCPVAFDDVMCWDLTKSGTVASMPCPSYVNGFNKNAFATRWCTENGTWWIHPDLNHTWTNFSECVKPAIDLTLHAEHGDKLRLLYTIGYSFSLGALLVAVTIMLCCRRLHSKTNSLHLNLFLAFILRAVLSFLKDILFVDNVGLAKDVHRREDGVVEFTNSDSRWECKLLMSVFMYSVSACNMWIFTEALYLTMLVTRPLTTERAGVRMYIILGWTSSLVLTVPWVIVKALREDTYCWNIQSNPDYYWILRGSGVGVVVINFFLFLNIFRKLFLKMRNSTHMRPYGKAKYRKLAKFILVLTPLFGVMYIVFYVAMPSNFEETNFNITYLYIEMGYNSFQGFLLALLFCFLNEEVHGELKRVWQRHRDYRHAVSSIKSYHFHSTNRRNHSTASRGSKDSHRVSANSFSSCALQQNRMKVLRTYSVSSDVSQSSSTTNNSARSFKHHSQVSPAGSSGHQLQMLRSVNNCALSLFANVGDSTSLLRQAIEANARRKLLRNNTQDSAESLPFPEEKVCNSGSDRSESGETGSRSSLNSEEKSL